jgi:hypothetical protein
MYMSAQSFSFKTPISEVPTGPYPPLPEEDVEEGVDVEEGEEVEKGEEISGSVVSATPPPPEVGTSQRKSSSLLVESQPKSVSQHKSSGQNKTPILQREHILFPSESEKTPERRYSNIYPAKVSTPPQRESISSQQNVSPLLSQPVSVSQSVSSSPKKMPVFQGQRIVFPSKTPTPVSSSSSSSIVPEVQQVNIPQERIPSRQQVSSEEEELILSSSSTPTDERTAVINLARLYVVPIKIDGRSPTRENNELYNFGLNLIENNKDVAQTIDELACLPIESLKYKNTKTKKLNRLYTTNNRTVKLHLKEAHGLILKTKIDLKDTLVPHQAQKCRDVVPPAPEVEMRRVSPVVQAQPEAMPIEPVIPPRNVDVDGLKRSIVSGVSELLDRLITNETLRGGKYRRHSKNRTMRSYRNKRRISHKHRKASKGRRTRRG